MIANSEIKEIRCSICKNSGVSYKVNGNYYCSRCLEKYILNPIKKEKIVPINKKTAKNILEDYLPEELTI